MGVSFILRWGKGSAVLTWTGASGAPKTPSNNLRSDRLLVLLQAFDEEDTTEDGPPLESCPFIHWPHLPSILESPPSSWSGPSFNGDKASAGLKLPDLGMIKGSGFATCCPCPFLLLNKLDIGDALLAGLFARDLPGDSPLTTEKNPCFLSIFTVLSLLQERS
jgi:hypothetical protein